MPDIKKMLVEVTSDNVVYTSISTSKDGYNYARVVIKKGKDEFMSISYEWEDANIPSFVMDLMGFMKSNNIETSSVWPSREADYEEYSSKNKEE